MSRTPYRVRPTPVALGPLLASIHARYRVDPASEGFADRRSRGGRGDVGGSGEGRSTTLRTRSGRARTDGIRRPRVAVGRSRAELVVGGRSAGGGRRRAQPTSAGSGGARDLLAHRRPDDPELPGSDRRRGGPGRSE